MKLVVGLGNPGIKYETTRHNAGFLAVDRIIERWNATGPNIKHEGEIYNASFRGEKILVVKPQTFMNLSGRTVGPLFQFYKCDPKDLILIYDEVDLKPQSIRIKIGGSPAGHNGVKSVLESVGNANKDFFRLRVGVGRPDLLPSGNKAIPVRDYVLQPFTDSELNALDPLLDDIASAAELLIEGKSTEAMNRYNVKEKPKKKAEEKD